MIGWEDSSNDSKGDLFRWTEAYLERTTYEICCPVIGDQALAPEGKTGIIISMLLEHRFVKRISEAGEY